MNNQDNNTKNKVLKFQEFVYGCINRLILGGAGLIILYFICSMFYNNWYLNAVEENLGNILRHLV